MQNKPLDSKALRSVVNLLEEMGERDLADTMARHGAARANGASVDELAQIWLKGA